MSLQRHHLLRPALGTERPSQVDRITGSLVFWFLGLAHGGSTRGRREDKDSGAAHSLSDWLTHQEPRFLSHVIRFELAPSRLLSPTVPVPFKSPFIKISSSILSEAPGSSETFNSSLSLETCLVVDVDLWIVHRTRIFLSSSPSEYHSFPFGCCVVISPYLPSLLHASFYYLSSSESFLGTCDSFRHIPFSFSLESSGNPKLHRISRLDGTWGSPRQPLSVQIPLLSNISHI